METRVLDIPDRLPEAREAATLGPVLEAGGLVAFPTDTVYGIAALKDSPEAIARLRRLKGRPEDKPFTVHLARRSDLRRFAGPVTPRARRLVSCFWPGPLTVILPDKEGVPTGFRQPASAAALALIDSVKGPVVGTSANLSGEEAPVTAEPVLEAFRGKVDAIIASGRTLHAAPSTVVSLAGPRVTLLREGAIDLGEIVPEAPYTILFVCTGNLCRSPMAEGIFRTLMAKRLGVAVEELERHGFRVGSAGTAGITGEPATPAAVRAAREHGADIRRHLSRGVTDGLVDEADRIVVATRRHAEELVLLFGDLADRITPLLPDGRDLPDPYGAADKQYRETAAIIREALGVLVDEMAGESAPED